MQRITRNCRHVWVNRGITVYKKMREPPDKCKSRRTQLENLKEAHQQLPSGRLECKWGNKLSGMLINSPSQNKARVSRKVWDAAGCVKNPMSDAQGCLRIRAPSCPLPFESHVRSCYQEFLTQDHERKRILEIVAPSLRQQSGDGNSKAAIDH